MNKDSPLTWIPFIVTTILQALLILVTLMMFVSSRFNRVDERIDKLYEFQVNHLTQLHAKSVAEK